MPSFLQRFLNIRKEELPATLASAAYFFCVLTALMVLRPARDSLGVQRGLDAVRWLFVGTAIVTLAVNPVFGLVVSRMRRLGFIAATYGFFAACLLVFYGLLTLTPAAIGEVSAMVFYVWFSVFNFFVTMVFWALMADRFTLDQSKRFFGVVAAGGTLGALFGPWLAQRLAVPLGTASLLLVAAAFLMLAVGAAGLVIRAGPTAQPGAPAAATERSAVIGGSAWAGFRSALTSPYLLGISAYVLILAVVVTFIYFTRLAMVAELGSDLDTRTTVFAQIDLIVQATTLVLQLVVTGHLMRRLGVSVTLALLPLVVVAGFAGLYVVGTLAALVIFEAVFRAVQRAIMRPARETLFTVVSREDKYKAKAFIDTFVYRVGDVAGAWTEGFLSRLGMGLVALSAAVVPIAAAWLALGLWLGREQRRRAGSPPATDDHPGVAAAGT